MKSMVFSFDKARGGAIARYGNDKQRSQAEKTRLKPKARIGCEPLFSTENLLYATGASLLI